MIIILDILKYVEINMKLPKLKKKVQYRDFSLGYM